MCYAWNYLIYGWTLRLGFLMILSITVLNYDLILTAMIPVAFREVAT